MNYVDFKVVYGGASCGTECGTVCFAFCDTEITFNVYQPSIGTDCWFVDLQDENIKIADELNIKYSEDNRIIDDILIQLIFDAYAIIDSKDFYIKCFNEEECLYKEMKYQLIDISSNGIIEEGWLQIEIEDTNGEKHEINFDIREECFNSLIDDVYFTSDDDKEIFEKLGIILDDDFKCQIMNAYGVYCNENR